MYGIDWNAPFSSNEEAMEDSVVVPVTDCPLSLADLAQLRAVVNPLAETDNHGIDFYVQTVEFVHSKVH